MRPWNSISQELIQDSLFEFGIRSVDITFITWVFNNIKQSPRKFPLQKFKDRSGNEPQHSLTEYTRIYRFSYEGSIQLRLSQIQMNLYLAWSVS